MIQDPIVEEVRAARDAFAKENDYDVDAIFATLRKLEARSGRDHVSLPAREVIPLLAGDAAQQGDATDGASRRR